MDEFYHYTTEDFVSIPVADVRVGDELSWGMDTSTMLYGICKIAKITDPYYRDGLSRIRVIDFLVTPGMCIHNMLGLDVKVRWEGFTPVITATQSMNWNEKILIRPRQEG